MISFLRIFFMCEYYLYVCKLQRKRPYFTDLIVFKKIIEEPSTILLGSMISFLFIISLILVNISESG